MGHSRSARSRIRTMLAFSLSARAAVATRVATPATQRRATPSTQVVAKVTPKEARRQKRHTKIRSKVSGTADRPRISVYRSNQHTYVQVIDDENQTTLCAGTMSPKIKEIVGS